MKPPSGESFSKMFFPVNLRKTSFNVGLLKFTRPISLSLITVLRIGIKLCDASSTWIAAIPLSLSNSTLRTNLNCFNIFLISSIILSRRPLSVNSISIISPPTFSLSLSGESSAIIFPLLINPILSHST